MRCFALSFVLLAALFLAPATASAHAANTSYLQADASDPEGEVRITWDLNAADLDWTVDLDLDTDGSVTWSEVLARRDAIASLAIANLIIQRDGNSCPVSMNDLALTEHTDATFVSLGLRAKCATGGALTIGSKLFFSQDASQRVLVQAKVAGQEFNTVLSPQAQSWVQPKVASFYETFLRFVQQGIVHVWSGYDHIAFVLLLVLPSVLRAGPKGWTNTSSVREVARDLLSIVTTFTLAHSITLTLAATRVVQLPERLVEVTIAASIVAAGALNLRPTPTRWRLAVAFGFGLMHGFGFARALLEIEVTGRRLLPMLAGFNVGVELAQLVIVIIALPLLLRLRAFPLYAARLMPAASLATAAVGAIWMFTRFRG